MAKYIPFTEEETRRAKQTDLVAYLRSRGETLIKSGREYRLKSDHSITVRGNEWFDHATRKGGLAIDFLQTFYGLDFCSAMEELIGGTVLPVYHKAEEPPKPFALPPRNVNMRRTFAYLTKHRGIAPKVLSFFAHEKLIYESCEKSKDGMKEYHNAVFVGLDENGIPAHGHKRSIYSQGKRFMQNVESSNPKHSFHYIGGGENLYVFESPIDLLSFLTLHGGEDWQKDNYVAMCGTSPLPMVELLDRHINLNHVVVCTDNDKAGHEAYERFTELLSERGVASSRMIPQTKDFNEDLLSTQVATQPTMEMRCI